LSEKAGGAKIVENTDWPFSHSSNSSKWSARMGESVFFGWRNLNLGDSLNHMGQ
jgi:hypothetical protein